MGLYQNLVERCFTSCCNDFTSKALSSKEVSPPSKLAFSKPRATVVAALALALACVRC